MGAGFLVQENFHPLFSGDNGPAIDQIPALPPALWFGMTLAIGICETLRIQKGWANPYESMDNVQSLKEGYHPGGVPHHAGEGALAWSPRHACCCGLHCSRGGD